MPKHIFIVGAQRSGTSSLHHILSQHPNMVSGKIGNKYTKELHYFDKVMDTSYKDYLSYFDKFNENDFLIDSTPNYVLFKSYLTKISQTVPSDKIKIVMIIRNPYDRLTSHMNMYSGKRNLVQPNPFQILQEELQNLNTSDIFEKTISYSFIRRSLYHHQILNLFEIFGEANVKIIFFENLIQNLEKVISDLCDFLEIEYFNFDETKSHKKINGIQARNLNSPFWTSTRYISKKLPQFLYKPALNIIIKILTINSKGKITLDADSIELLKELFELDISNLEQLLNVNLSKWRK